jgi:hypothetical protein
MRIIIESAEQANVAIPGYDPTRAVRQGRILIL